MSQTFHVHAYYISHIVMQFCIKNMCFIFQGEYYERGPWCSHGFPPSVPIVDLPVHGNSLKSRPSTLALIPVVMAQVCG